MNRREFLRLGALAGAGALLAKPGSDSASGIPILLKDNIDTADRTMTAAGSLALVGDPPA